MMIFCFVFYDSKQNVFRQFDKLDKTRQQQFPVILWIK